MTTAERLADALKAGNKTRGFKEAVYFPDGRLYNYRVHNVEVAAGDIVEICPTARDTADKIVAALYKGCICLPPEERVTILADDLYHLLDAVQK